MTNDDLRYKPEVPTTGKSIRICLGCSKEFKSQGPGNRICSVCGKAKKRITDISLTPINLPPPRKGHT